MTVHESLYLFEHRFQQYHIGQIQELSKDGAADGERGARAYNGNLWSSSLHSLDQQTFFQLLHNMDPLTVHPALKGCGSDSHLVHCKQPLASC